MIYCLNPKCSHPDDPMNTEKVFCRHCGAKLILQNRYLVVDKLPEGGFSKTYVVEDNGNQKVLKVLKLYKFETASSKEIAIRLFKKEFEVLSSLNQSGIPKVEPDGYLQLLYPACNDPLHCIVIEKIEGVNLKQWLEKRENQPISVTQAINWLKELLQILQELHSKKYFHRDIKPENIMVKEDEHLVLIDFGGVKDLAQTILQQDHTAPPGTAFVSVGYTPIEQIHGRAVIQSDFFALARTFVHLLTGKHPINLTEDKRTGKLLWRDLVDDTPNSFQEYLYQYRTEKFFDLLDWMMESDFSKRPQNTADIFKKLNQIHLFPIPYRSIGAAFVLIVSTTLIYSYITGLGGCYRNSLRNFPRNDNMSCGEEIVMRDAMGTDKINGVNAYAAGDYQKAIVSLEKAWKNMRDAETLIYLNNARLEANGISYNTIAVVVPLKNDNDSIQSSQEMLQGVAQAQNEYNQNLQPGQIGLKILIANDENDQYFQAKKIAEDLAKKSDVLAVIGHFRSDTTKNAIPVYQKHKLLLISPTATAEDLSKECQSTSPSCFFRVVPSNRSMAQVLAKYLRKPEVNKKKVAIFYQQGSTYSESMRLEMKNMFQKLGGQTVDFYLSSDLEQDFTKIKEQNVDAIAVFPTSDGRNSDPAVQVMEKARENKYLVVGGDSLDSYKLLREVNGNPAGAVVALPWSPQIKLNQEFPVAARDLWQNNVNWHAALSYDATRVLLKALENLPSASRASLQQKLAGNFQASGATGEIMFEADGDRKSPQIQLVKVVWNQNTTQLEFQTLSGM